MVVRRAFTLIELLVVVAIVAILISVLLPALSTAREQARTSVCLANMRSLGMAVTTYLQQNGERFPTVGFGHGGASNSAASWVTLLGADYGRRGGDTRGSGASTMLLSEVADIRRCPTDQSPFFGKPNIVAGEPLWRQASYASSYFFEIDDEEARELFGKQRAFQSLGRVVRPASTIYWGELIEVGEYATSDHVHPELWLSNPQVEPGRQLAMGRHRKRENYAMVDGHAESLPFIQTYQLDPASSDIFTGTLVWFVNKWDPDVAR